MHAPEQPHPPLPVVDEDSRPYWEAARRHILLLPRCNGCGRFVFYPRRLCPYCHSATQTWEPLSGHGILYSYTVVRIPISPTYEGRVPYVVALVDLKEGPRMLANLVDAAPDEVRIGAEVEVTFQRITSEITLPQFRLRPTSS